MVTQMTGVVIQLDNYPDDTVR